MKRLLIEDGIRTSLASVLNETQNIYEGNFAELVSTLYQPGFFINKDESTGLYLDDFKPVIENKKIKISVGSDGISEAYMGGKVLTLNGDYYIEPFFTVNQLVTTGVGSEVEVDIVTGPIQGIDIDYYVWAIPRNTDTRVVDYLPNYKADGQTKNLIRNYSLDFVLVKVSETTAYPNPGIKVCKVTINGSNQTITNLVDLRMVNRAYIRPELYDFFTSAFLKQKFNIVNIGSGFNYSETKLTLSDGTNDTPIKLNGHIQLLASKTPPCKIKVNFIDFDITLGQSIDSGIVIYVEVTPEDFYNTSTLTKTPQKQTLDEFTPTENKIVIAVHKKIYDPQIDDEQV